MAQRPDGPAVAARGRTFATRARSPTDLRTELAIVALERAFDRKGLGTRMGVQVAE